MTPQVIEDQAKAELLKEEYRRRVDLAKERLMKRQGLSWLQRNIPKIHFTWR